MILRLAPLAIVLSLLAGSAAADPSQIARQASDRLDAAAAQLKAAAGSRDRIAALTATIRAYEDGLSALREGLRGAYAREAQITAQLEGQRADLSVLLGALQTMGAAPEATLLLHPSGPVGTARAGMLMRDVTPAVLARVAALRADLSELATLRALQSSASGTLNEGLRGVQTARAALSQAVSDRTDLPPRLTDDGAAVTRLAESARTLDGFAGDLAALPGAADANLPDFAQAKGDLALPVAGTLRRGFNAADAAGIARPGWVLDTPPGALVTAPWPATIRYLGPLLDYANVILLEPSEGYLLVLAGLETVYGRAQDVVATGAPLGLMPGADDPAMAGFDPDRERADGDGPVTLYVELRDGQMPVDPASWFALDGEN